jgi:hypothetical protein
MACQANARGVYGQGIVLSEMASWYIPALEQRAKPEINGALAPSWTAERLP